jgi:NDP-sugar pyrophosphorylase family protein
MTNKEIFQNIDVLVLCGGKGTRMLSLAADKPKVLLDLWGRPFLDILIENLASFGFKRIILGVGHLKEKIIDHYVSSDIVNAQIDFSTEDMPLGTGGAVKKARPFIKSDNFLVMNGDGFCSIDYQKFYENHLNKKALFSLVLNEISDTSGYGNVRLGDNDRILEFAEKKSDKKTGLISAGIYFMNQDIFSYMPKQDVFSLEYDLFPKILNKPCYGFIGKNFIDIGTLEKYQKANESPSKLI